MGKYAARLAKADEQWKNTESGFPEIPPGDYVAQVRSAEVKETSSGSLCAVLSLVIASGEQRGTATSVWYTLESAKEDAVRVGISMLKETFEKLGREVPESMGEVEDALELLGAENPVIMVKAEKSKKGDRVFVRVVGVASAADLEGVEVPEAAAEEAAPEAAAEPETDETTPEIAEGSVVTFENEGRTYRGAVVATDGATAKVQTAEGEIWEDIPHEYLSLAAEEEPPEDQERAELLSFAAANGINVDDSMDKDEVKKVISASAIAPANLTPAEIALLKKSGIKISIPKAPAPSPAKVAMKPAAKAPAKPAAKPAAKAPAKTVARKK